EPGSRSPQDHDDAVCTRIGRSRLSPRCLLGRPQQAARNARPTAGTRLSVLDWGRKLGATSAPAARQEVTDSAAAKSANIMEVDFEFSLAPLRLSGTSPW